MGQIILNSAGGSGILSEDLTATKGYVKSGLTYMGADTNDEAGVGTLPIINNSNIILPINGVYTVPHGWHPGTEVVSQNIPTFAGGTYTPTTSDIVVAKAGTYLSGDVTIKGGGPDFDQSNVKKNVQIFNITGESLDPSRFNLSSSSVTLYAEQSTTITISNIVGSNSWNIYSTNTNVAAVSKSGNNLTIRAVGGGSANIIVIQNKSSTYAESSASITVSVNALMGPNDIYYKGNFRPGWYVSGANNAGNQNGYLWLQKTGSVYVYGYWSTLNLYGPTIYTGKVHCRVIYSNNTYQNANEFYVLNFQAYSRTLYSSTWGTNWRQPGGLTYGPYTLDANSQGTGGACDTVRFGSSQWSTGGESNDSYPANVDVRIDRVWFD